VEQELERQSHFAISDHALTFFGTCQDCGTVPATEFAGATP